MNSFFLKDYFGFFGFLAILAGGTFGIEKHKTRFWHNPPTDREKGWVFSSFFFFLGSKFPGLEFVYSFS